MVKRVIFKYSVLIIITKMVKKVIEASVAVAHAARLCKPAVIPIYPITPQLG